MTSTLRLALVLLVACGGGSGRGAVGSDAGDGRDGAVTDAAADAAVPVPSDSSVDASAADAGPALARSVMAGDTHTCAVMEDGRLFCWGSNGSGEIGDGTTAPSRAPFEVLRGLRVAAAGAGGAFTCASLVEGNAYCWGKNVYGTLGIGSAGAREETPRPVSDLSDVIAVAAAFEHACALRSDGTVACWGLNTVGQLGIGLADEAGARPAPEDATGLDDAIAITAAAYHSCAIRAGGQVACWGAGASLGDGTGTSRSSPVAVPGLDDALAIAAGNTTVGDTTAGHTCAVQRDGRVVCWGSNAAGQLGDDTTVDRTTPVEVLGLSDATAIAAGALHSCAVLASGEARCWGDNTSGQLGDGTTMRRTTPVAVSGLSDAVAVAAGTAHTCAVRSGGEIVCWGANGSRQLGDGTVEQRLTPTPVAGL